MPDFKIGDVVRGNASFRNNPSYYDHNKYKLWCGPGIVEQVNPTKVRYANGDLEPWPPSWLEHVQTEQEQRLAHVPDIPF